MYVRNTNERRRVRPPDNYSGNAFDSNGYRLANGLPIPPSLMPAAEGELPNGGDGEMPVPELGGGAENYVSGFGASDREELPTGIVAEESCTADRDRRHSDGGCDRGGGGGLRGLLSSILPPRAEGEKWEFGFEDMLIIGLIFLLSQSEGDEEILLLLMVLLFYK